MNSKTAARPEEEFGQAFNEFKIGGGKAVCRRGDAGSMVEERAVGLFDAKTDWGTSSYFTKERAGGESRGTKERVERRRNLGLWQWKGVIDFSHHSGGKFM